MIFLFAKVNNQSGKSTVVNWKKKKKVETESFYVWDFAHRKNKNVIKDRKLMIKKFSREMGIKIVSLT